MDLHAECAESAHPCFRCKMRIWRHERRTPFAKLQVGWADLPSVASRAKETVEIAKQNGRDIHLVDDRYRWV